MSPAKRPGKGAGIPFTRGDRQSAFAKLMDFAMRSEFAEEGRLATVAFWSPWFDARGDEDGRRAMDLQESVHAFSTWFALDFHLASGATLLQLMLRQPPVPLGRGEHAYLDRMREAHLRPYQVTEVKLDEGLRLLDLWTREEVWVQERLATRQLVRWDVLAVRLMPGAAGNLVIEGMPYLYPAGSKEVLLRNLRRSYREFKRSAPSATLTDFFRRVTPLFHHFWLETVALRPLPKLVTAEGDTLVFARAIFDVRDRRALLAALDNHPDLHRGDDGSYGWLEDTPEFKRALGRFVLEKNRLVLETQSKERVERGRAFVHSLAGAAARFRLVEYEDPARALERVARSPKPAPSGDRVPPEIEAQIVGEFFEQHYRRWLDEPVPALGNRTPREAARLKTGRPKLVALLQEFENMAARQRLEGRPAYDFGWMWAELGLERPG